ncbi:MAG: ATP-binding protein [Desulfovibrionaceae bacterium]
MTLRTFQMRILIWVAALLVAALAALFMLASRAVEARLVAEAQHKALRELDAVDFLLQHHAPFTDDRELDGFAEDLGARLGIRITYIQHGHVLADSNVPYDKVGGMQDHSDRPEVLAAEADGQGADIRTSATLDRKMLYVARAIPAGAGLPGGVLRLAVPFSDVAQSAAQARDSLAVAAVAVLLLAAALGWGLTSIMTRSLRAFSSAVAEIGAGNYQRRIREVPGGEFAPLAESVNAMAASIARHVALVEDQRGQLEAVFQGMHEGVAVLDAEGRIESCNAAFRAMFPDAPAPEGRTPLEATMRLEIQDAVDALVMEPDRASAGVGFELPSGRHLDLCAVPYLDHNAQRKIVLVLHDVTEVRRGETALKNFVANASHQLRTPLTSIQGYAETLLDNPPDDPATARRFLATIRKNAVHVSGMISSLLALARSERAQARNSLEPVNIALVLHRAVTDLEPLAQRRGIRMDTAGVDEVLVLGEPEGLLHLLHNLLHNALKHSPDGGVITVSAERHGDEAVFAVHDQGPGVPKEHAERIFERFYRVDANAVGDDGGSGLGLAICRQIARNFGGDVWYQTNTREGAGATFRFRLRTDGPEPEPQPEPGRSSEPA